MSSYQEEYRKGFEAGLESGREVANKMMDDGYQKGLKEFRIFEDENSTVYYHLTKVFEYLGVEKQPKLVDRYKTYIIEDAKSLNG